MTKCISTERLGQADPKNGCGSGVQAAVGRKSPDLLADESCTAETKAVTRSRKFLQQRRPRCMLKRIGKAIRVDSELIQAFGAH